MILNSLSFLLILPLLLFLYILVVRLCRNRPFENLVSAAVLTAISYGFFIVYQPAGAVTLFVITLLTYSFSLIIEKEPVRGRRPFLIVAFVSVAVMPLIVFKYAAFIADSVNAVLSSCDAGNGEGPDNSFLTNLFIPLGISFFTFQSLGYMWDVYRGKISAERNFLYYMLFVGFFPQIASGPISRGGDLLPQIKGKRRVTEEDIAEGFRLMLWGFFLKAVVADRVATFVNPVYSDYANFSGATCLMASIFYSIQIYGDFAGYSLIAIGVGRLFGFRLINNFNRPYFSHSISDFWRRWHISLSLWLRDYVYIPLGGSRKGEGRTHANIMTTFIVSGIWHGANLTFIVWGFIHGAFQCLEKLLGINGKPKNAKLLPLRIVITFLMANFAWIFFRMPTLKDAIAVIERIFTLAPGASLTMNRTETALILFAVTSLFATEIIQEYFPRVALLRHSNKAVRMVTIVSLIFIILTVGVLDAGQFIYVNF